MYNVIQRPSKSKALSFLASLFGFVMFAVMLLFLLVDERGTEKAHLEKLTICDGLSNSVTTVEELRIFMEALSVRFPQDGVWSGNMLVGSVGVFTQRSQLIFCGAAPQSLLVCMSELPLDTREFVGNQSNLSFRFTSFSGSVRSTIFGEDYLQGGYALFLLNGTLFANNCAVKDVPRVIGDLLDEKTRLIYISFTLFNPQYALLCHTNLAFELPTAGGVFSGMTVDCIPCASLNTLALCCEVGCWIYCAVWLLVSCLEVTWGLLMRRTCVLCKMGPQADVNVKCWHCDGYTAVNIHQTDCSSCKTALMVHTCWRAKAFCFWTWAKLGVIGLYFSARGIVYWERNAVAEEFAAISAARTPSEMYFVASVSSSQAVVIIESLCVITTFVCVYRYLARAPWAAAFVHMCSSGMTIFGFYIVSFAVVFLGFAFAFHVLLCEDSDEFAFTSRAIVSTFRAFMSILEWKEVSTDERRWVLYVLYVVFAWICVLLMLNVFISLVTSQYESSSKRISGDIETQSVKLLVQTLFSSSRRLAIPPMVMGVRETEKDTASGSHENIKQMADRLVFLCHRTQEIEERVVALKKLTTVF